MKADIETTIEDLDDSSGDSITQLSLPCRAKILVVVDGKFVDEITVTVAEEFSVMSKKYGSLLREKTTEF